MTYRIIISDDPVVFADTITQKLSEGFQFMGPIIIHETNGVLSFVREMMRDSSVKPAPITAVGRLKQ